MGFITNITTGIDNRTHDVARVLAILSFVVGLSLTVYTVVWKNQVFDLQQFGIGVGSMFAGLGAALLLKKDTEPKE